MAESLEEFESFAIELAREAGKIINDASGVTSSKSIETKQSYADLVTETDKGVESFLFEELRKRFPSHKFIGEENVAEQEKREFTEEPTWIIDPVDGTLNFVHTLPFVAVCIGLAIKKECVVGVVYCPFLDHLYHARKGAGAFLNGTKLQVRPSASLKESLICTELGNDRDDKKRDAVFKNLQAIGWQCHGIRMMGSAALNICAVASGQVNLYYEWGLHCWDMAAALVILTEAGGCVFDPTGGKFDLFSRKILASSSEKLAVELSKALVVQLDLPRD
ncbi:Inositol monophosphatase 1, partial [Fragariocoptes setiger]